MTFTIAEVFLLVWALVASATAYHFYRQFEIGREILFEVLDNEQVRNEMVKCHKDNDSR